MTPYSTETWIGLMIASLPALFAAYLYLIQSKHKSGLILLLLSALLLRLVMISLDPYLHEWDERYHALVARNMISDPFKPMLFVKHIMTYNPEDWGYMHIWVHKQPLFLWQMALSMKLFGVSTFAMRLPSAIMGAIMVWMTYKIGENWLKDEKLAFLAAFISTFAYYSLELISGSLSLEHNDLAFTFYMTCSLWAFTEYIKSDFKLKWAIWMGVFSGLSILNKWLVGLLIFGGWGLYLILSFSKLNWKSIFHITLSAIIACVVFLPWQWYILHEFPVESAIAFEGNRKHMSTDLSHPGGPLFHIQFLTTAYHWLLLPFLVIGTIFILLLKEMDKKMTLSFLAMILVLFGFFSLFVATKMPAFVYPVSALLIIFMAAGIYYTIKLFCDYAEMNTAGRNLLLLIVVVWAGYISLKPWLIIEFRSKDNMARNIKINNNAIFKSIDSRLINDRVFINTRPYENIELMFYKGGIAYHWYPTETTLDSLQNLGYKFAAFNYENDQQSLPGYITSDSTIMIMKERLK